MQPNSLMIARLADLSLLEELAVDAAADGRRMVARLMSEWHNGSNRFDRPGEAAHIATIGGRAVAVCGLNIDPFASDASVGRVRRLYVAAAHRRQGIARAVMQKLEEDAFTHFRVLHLRTDDAGAAAFYEAIGFARVAGDSNCTHRRALQTT